jgi:CheY-like chemotaxis protein
MLDVIFIGDWTDSQFGQTLAWLRDHVRLREFAVVETAEQSLQDKGLCPVVVFLGQSRRGQFGADCIERLLRAAPLARIVVIIGAWCEGETRSGAPLAGTHRVAWHQAPHVAPRELAALAAGRASIWSWPAGDDQAAPRPVFHSQTAGRLIVALSESRASAESIALALRELGFSTLAGRPAQPVLVFGATAVVWDVPASNAHADAQWRSLQEWLPNVPVVALVGFPRVDDVERLRSLGVSAVLAKPFQIDDLVSNVQSLADDCKKVVMRQAIAAA